MNLTTPDHEALRRWAHAPGRAITFHANDRVTLIRFQGGRQEITLPTVADAIQALPGDGLWRSVKDPVDRYHDQAAAHGRRGAAATHATR